MLYQSMPIFVPPMSFCEQYVTTSAYLHIKFDLILSLFNLITLFPNSTLSKFSSYVTGFAKMCIVHTKILIRFFDPAYSYTQ